MPRNPETHAKSATVEAIWAQLPIDEWVTEIDELVEVTEYIA
jgi:hypothetical protein